MTKFHVLTAIDQPSLWIWRDKPAGVSAQLERNAEYKGEDGNGLQLFQATLDHQIHEPAHALLHQGTGWDVKERDEHAKTLPRTSHYRFPADLWCAEGSSRVLTTSPFTSSRDRVRIHLITARKYVGGKLFMWTPGGTPRRVGAADSDDLGPFFDVALEGRDQHLFLFKFESADGRCEPEYANRLWCAQDGQEIWVHSQSSSVSTRRPGKKPLVVHYLELGGPDSSPQMHLWQPDSDFEATFDGTREAGGWIRFEYDVFTDRPYGFKFFNRDLQPPWESTEADRNVFLKEDGTVWTPAGDGSARRLGRSGAWTLEGDHELFGAKPEANREVSIELARGRPGIDLPDPLSLDVWINRARTPFKPNLSAGGDGRWTFKTYPEVVTSFRFRSGDKTEPIDRHFVKISEAETRPTQLVVVLGRPDTLRRAPPEDLFLDPPFTIRRPGAWVEDGQVRFAVHCPTAALVEVVGEWTGWQKEPLAMRSTRDGTYWWAQVPVADIKAKLNRPTIHGVLYKYLLNQVRLVQDPAADWVESSDPEQASKLVDHARYAWKSDWHRPSWDWLTVYQLHPSRFAQRDGTMGFAGVTRELTEPNGYLRGINATAILMLPVSEYMGGEGWGYNPSFFYAVESAYGGPDELKRLVDACHAQGKAVLLDMVFNHAGTDDNVLWSVARESNFQGDTAWGAMINFDHPQVIHFFEQNLVHFMENYRIDGFRFDFTRVIRYANTGGDYNIRQAAQGDPNAGWEFMRRLRAAADAVDGRCLFMAEHYPNEWDLTRKGGPMNSQWCDAFHDRIVDACRGADVMGPLADALKITHSPECDDWYQSTNFGESHDEAGNRPDRISHVAYFRPGNPGYRCNKVAAAATLLSRGIPMWFMGQESGEWRQFAKGGRDTLDLAFYEKDEQASRVRAWWNKLCELRRGNSRIQGPAPLQVHYAQDGMLAFSRGDGADIWVLLNFGDWSGWRPLSEFNLPAGEYKELINSTWGDYRVEREDEHSNGGWEARLRRDDWINLPDYGVVVLEKRS